MGSVMVVMEPNRTVSKSAMRTLIFGQVAVFLLYWSLATPPVIPKPGEVLRSLGDLWSNGLMSDLLVSLTLYAEAVALASVLSLLIAYSTAMAFFRPVASLWADLRFLSTMGLPFLLTLYIHSAHGLKLAVLTFSISVFATTGMLDVIATIPREKFDLARTLRMGEWQVVWEVIVLGRIDYAFDVMRQNAAIGFFMLPMVEGLWKSEGGIGALMDIQNKHFGLEAIAAIQISILVVGLLQDWLIGVVKGIVCPYATLLLERK